MDRPPSKREKKHKKILKIIEKTHKKHPVWGVDPIWAELKKPYHVVVEQFTD
jgi:putative transposase